MSVNILQYESKVWATADLLIGAGIKQSDFPKFMMPYFALIMVESRLIRESEILRTEFDENEEEIFIEEFKDLGLGYNDVVVRHKKTLKDICANDKTFETDFDAYLKAFDPMTRDLLGVGKGTEETRYLDISGVTGLLKKKSKDILFATLQAWSAIDLVPFNNSEITTLEEHIKRKWADISAETAGEQYTPDDIIYLIAEIITDKTVDGTHYLTIYDPTCGGGNLLFGVEDKIKTKFSRPTKTFGEDWSDSLYALAKIESRFRTESSIEYGNTLTKLSFIDKRFDIIVANPPYGVDWKGYQKDINNDSTERFVDKPSISDGQFLFTQHILYHLTEKGLAVVVHNGSTLFSGDAGSGESNIRKHFFDKDYVEAIIQMPTDEFFNTGIYTYLWVFNKDKAANRKDKVMLINASELFKPLKKSKGKKRKEMAQDNRDTIVKTLADFKDTDFAKVFPKEHFYYNKQAIMLTNVDDKRNSLAMPKKINKDGEESTAKSIKLGPLSIKQIEPENPIEFTEFEITAFDATQFSNLNDYFERGVKPKISALDYKEKDLKITTAHCVYWYDADKETIIEVADGKQTALGCGRIVVKATYKKAGKGKTDSIEITAELTPDYQKDYEIVPFSPIPKKNAQLIAAFMKQYITKPFAYLDNTVGVEINFNKVFYKPEILRGVADIVADLQSLDNQLVNLENELKL